MQGELIPCSDGLNEPEPLLLGYPKVRFIGIENIAEGPRPGSALFSAWTHKQKIISFLRFQSERFIPERPWYVTPKGIGIGIQDSAIGVI
jgi:hypothetical protein